MKTETTTVSSPATLTWTKADGGYVSGSFTILKETARKFHLYVSREEFNLDTVRCTGSLAECKETAEGIASAVAEAEAKEAAEELKAAKEAMEAAEKAKNAKPEVTPEPAPVEPVIVTPEVVTPEPKETEMAATKTPAAPAAKKTPAAKPANQLGSAMIKVLKALKAKPMSRAEISAKTGINSGFTSLLGHLEPAKREAQSLSARGLIKPTTEDRDGKNVVVWNLTAAGTKALEAAAK